jgi:hypothetical protein
MQSIIQPSTTVGAVLEWLGLATLGICVLLACDPEGIELLAPVVTDDVLEPRRAGGESPRAIP